MIATSCDIILHSNGLTCSYNKSGIEPRKQSYFSTVQEMVIHVCICSPDWVNYTGIKLAIIPVHLATPIPVISIQSPPVDMI